MGSPNDSILEIQIFYLHKGRQNLLLRDSDSPRKYQTLGYEMSVPPEIMITVIATIYWSLIGNLQSSFNYHNSSEVDIITPII